VAAASRHRERGHHRLVGVPDVDRLRPTLTIVRSRSACRASRARAAAIITHGRSHDLSAVLLCASAASSVAPVRDRDRRGDGGNAAGARRRRAKGFQRRATDALFRPRARAWMWSSSDRKAAAAAFGRLPADSCWTRDRQPAAEAGASVVVWDLIFTQPRGRRPARLALAAACHRAGRCPLSRAVTTCSIVAIEGEHAVAELGAEHDDRSHAGDP
jgi:hypothetical protein